MEKFREEELKKLYLPPKDSHKGQNGHVKFAFGESRASFVQEYDQNLY